ncbi:MAG TPA: serine/threonine-protein kinase [Gemmataceae bacterium]|nr:serine/threonine-protein kinase [Gemmataceae bacterium]
MSDALGDALQKNPTPQPSGEPLPTTGDEIVVNLFNGSAEPTDDAPTVISKTLPQQTGIRTEDQAVGGLRGRRLAHFELIEPIGVGGMAAVLRARDTQLDRLVALKILPPEMAADPENVRRFHQEARSAARLDHENIARVFFCGEDQRLHFIAFEFVEGDNLRTILEKRGRLPVGEALHYMLQVAAGLAHAARRGVVHRDIKPSNIIITPNGRAKLVDMGLARSLEPQHDMGLTQSGVTLGTFDYISPEQALEPRDADVRSDIYSLGCTLYHMLTGQAPVPEGTAAKKLHHHQHVKPTDPRQFVPDLPDEVAVILDRMMAKHPKDRYQTPEHLVHHLYLAARKLDATAEVPEGVLAVEAALPSPPAGRPLVLAAVAAIILVGLIFLIDLASGPNPQPALNPLIDSRVANADKESPRPQQASSTAVSTAENTPPKKILEQTDDIPTFSEEKPTAAALAEFAQKNKKAPAIIFELDDLTLSTGDDKAPDIVISNPVVTIRPRKRGQRPTIRDQYRAREPGRGGTFQASLTIESKSCTIENIRFVLNQAGASVPMTILWLRNTPEVNIRNCEFIQANPCNEREKAKDSRMASILAESSNQSSLNVTGSCFLGFGSMGTKTPDAGKDMVFSGAAAGGQDAITRRGPVRIEANNCLFGPHAAVFRLEGAATGDSSPLRLTHCSVLAANLSTIYDLADGADAQIVANYSLFSNVGDPTMMGMSEDKGAVLVRRASSQGQFDYRGLENRYHKFENYLVIADAAEEMMQSLRDELKIQNSEILETSPWKDAEPLVPLKQLNVQTAFEVNPSLPELRLPSHEKANGKLIGAERVLAFSYVDKLPELKKAPEVASRPDLVVQTKKKADEEKRLYRTLEHALLDAQPGDTIRLQIDGEIKLDPRLLSDQKLTDLTIRADPGFDPILTINEEEQGNVPALFAVCNGKLRLEGLKIRLRPRGDDDWCAVFSFFGDGECVLKNCVVTLERSSRKAALAVLPQKRMAKAASSTKRPRLLVENCLIRGQGDFLWMQDGHSAEVAIENSVIALSGSLLNIESNKQGEKDDQPSSLAPLTLRLRKVTTYLGENLIRLHADKDVKGLPKLRCEPSDCLFLPARDRALVRLEGPEAEEKSLRDKMSWESTGTNAYGNFTALLEQQAIDSMMKWPSTSSHETWQRDVSGETSSKYSVKLPSPPPVDAVFTQLLPAAFRPDDSLKDYGADLSALRSLATPKSKPEKREPFTEFPDFEQDFPE